MLHKIHNQSIATYSSLEEINREAQVGERKGAKLTSEETIEVAALSLSTLMCIAYLRQIFIGCLSFK